ncbi:hypothetical protein VTL71DRAFT_14375 [Oculimacula yallundae]|uniref:N-acetyltransferase domain-containing protein n=1 Tax=Oculimacula yallundae TaxID=86028 RepID=A0ABR4CJM6_9HELO
MGIFPVFGLNWKGKSKSSSSSTSGHHIPSLFSRSQGLTPSTATPRWVRTPHWNQNEASSSNTSTKNADQEYWDGIENPDESGRLYPQEIREKRCWQCEHKANCDLTNRACCACLDRRPMNLNYFIYKDGRGMVAEGTRWGTYCPKCKVYWARQQGTGMPDPSSPTLSTSQSKSRKQASTSGPAQSTFSLKPEQEQEQRAQVEASELPPPPYSPSAVSDGWETLPRYRAEGYVYGGRTAPQIHPDTHLRHSDFVICNTTMSSPTEWYKSNFLFSTNPILIQPAAVNAAFATDYIHWAKPMEEDLLRTMLDNSLCIGVYELPKSSAEIAGRSDPKQIGLARLITDRVSFAYLTDVYILEPYQGQGLGKFLISCIDETLNSWPQFRRALLMADSKEKRFYEQMLGMKELVQGNHGYTMMTRKGAGSMIPGE